MRREPIELQEFLRGDGTQDAVRATLARTQAAMVATEDSEERMYGSELGRNLVRAKVKYTARVAEVEDRITAARFRGKDWNVRERELSPSYSYITLGLERA